jgi:hypothetical protein
VVERQSSGEDELNPLYIGAYGQGAKPVLETGLKMWNGPYENLVIQGVEFTERPIVLKARTCSSTTSPSRTRW